VILSLSVTSDVFTKISGAIYKPLNTFLFVEYVIIKVKIIFFFLKKKKQTNQNDRLIKESV